MQSFYALLVVPTLIVDFFCIAAGAGTIVRSSNNVMLIMNTVVACFVLELDELGYRLFLAKTYTAILSGVPAFNAPLVVSEAGMDERMTNQGRRVVKSRILSMSGKGRFYALDVWPFLIFLAIIAIDFMLYFCWCTVPVDIIPDSGRLG